MRALFSRTARTRVASAPTGSRAYAVGDVHGRLDLLEDLLHKLECDHLQRAPAKTYLVMLGDLIDRGPDSRGVLEYFVAHPLHWARVVHLKGNHEEYLLNILNGATERVPDWLAYGGMECLQSYGLSQGWVLNAPFDAIVERLSAVFPEAHRAFLEEMGDTFRFGGYLFVHAGIRPGVPISEQSVRDLRLIREGFLDDRTDHGVIVVHGHTIVDRPEEHPNRIALDTGAYKSDRLTALRLEGTERSFIEAVGQMS